jgi:hypothetical protein
MPPLSLAHLVLLFAATDAFDVSDGLLLLPVQATNPSSAMLLIQRFGFICWSRRGLTPIRNSAAADRPEVDHQGKH